MINDKSAEIMMEDALQLGDSVNQIEPDLAMIDFNELRRSHLHFMITQRAGSLAQSGKPSVLHQKKYSQDTGRMS